jgi:hypothetical protein
MASPQQGTRPWLGPARGIAAGLRAGARPTADAARSRRDLPGFGLRAMAVIDEMFLAAMSARSLVPEAGQLQRLGADVARTVDVLRSEGWLEDPQGFHQTPSAPTPTVRQMSRPRVKFEELTFPSGYKPRPGIAGSAHWQGFTANRTAHAYVMRHPGGEKRPWLVNVHGFSRGQPSDLLGFRAPYYHRALGMNVLNPVLPLHGPRRAGRRSGDGFATFDYLNNLHGLTQAVWDLRRCLAWIREQGGTDIVLHGISLGTYPIAILAGLDSELTAAIVGVPSVDLAAVLRVNAPADARAELLALDLLGPLADDIHRVVSPLSFECLLPTDRRFIYAGLADRIATPEPAKALHAHWDECRICWFHSSHVGYIASPKARRFVELAVRSALRM